MSFKFPVFEFFGNIYTFRVSQPKMAESPENTGFSVPLYSYRFHRVPHYYTDYGPEGRGFESLTAYQKSSKSSDFEDFCFL